MNNKEFHQRLTELTNLWLKEFNLKSIDDSYIPNIPKEVKAYIGNKDMKITQGSFMKLLLKNRESMITYIKPTIENPNLVLDNGRGILFIKEFIDENKNIYFMSVSKQFDGEWIFTSHTRREFENIKNEINKSKIIIARGFERSEVAGACDILESGGEVSKPSHLQIKYTANQDFGTNPNTNSTQKSPQSQTNRLNTVEKENRVATQKHYLYVPYKDREEAKSFGAKWDSELKKWYVSNDTDLKRCSKWQYPQENEIDINEVYAQFSRALIECGLKVAEPIMDGKLRRVEAQGDKGSQKSGAYIGYLDGLPAGFIENFKTGQRITWKFQHTREEKRALRTLNNAEIEAIKKANKLKAVQREIKQVALNEKTASFLQDEYETMRKF